MAIFDHTKTGCNVCSGTALGTSGKTYSAEKLTKLFSGSNKSPEERITAIRDILQNSGNWVDALKSTPGLLFGTIITAFTEIAGSFKEGWNSITRLVEIIANIAKDAANGGITDTAKDDLGKYLTELRLTFINEPATALVNISKELMPLAEMGLTVLALFDGSLKSESKTEP